MSQCRVQFWVLVASRTARSGDGKRERDMAKIKDGLNERLNGERVARETESMSIANPY